MREGFNPFYTQPVPVRSGPPRLTFSRTEVLHLGGAVVLLTLCVGVIVNSGRPPLLAPTRDIVLIPAALDLLAAFFAVASGFILHELAHKVLAQNYGHWAEFRAQFGQLGFSYLLVAFTGILFAAPGAVHILGRVTPRENGLISLVGPGTNFVIALVAWPLAWSAQGALNPDSVPTLQFILGVVAFANALLCVFNLIPFGPLDGKKVLAWSKPVYFGALAAGAALMLGVVFYRYGF